MSINTVRALAFSLATTGTNNWICNQLEIKPSGSLGDIFRSATIKHATSITFDMLLNGNFPTKLSELVMPFVADVFGEFSAKSIKSLYQAK